LSIKWSNEMFVLYTSPDGRNWSIMGGFHSTGAADVNVGSPWQSPASDVPTLFSDLNYSNARFNDF